jgi:AcrR family transcriptional regulator
MLAAADALFAANGYRATTTKEIAARAGVAEPTLFRNFGSKASLFEAAFVEPLNIFIDGWVQSWHDFPETSSVHALAESLVDGLYTLVLRHRKLFQELLEARSDPTNDLHDSAVTISTRLRQGLRAVQDVGLDIASQRDLQHLDPPATISSVAATIIGSILLDDWITPLGMRRPSHSRMVEEITLLITYGITGRPT